MTLTPQRKAEIDAMLGQSAQTQNGLNPQRKAEIDAMLQQTQPEQKQPGFLESIAKPFTKTIASVANLAEGTGRLVSSLPGGLTQEEINKAHEATIKERDFGPFGTARPVGFSQETGEKLSVGRGVADILGTGAEIGSYIAPVSIGAGVAKGATMGIGQAIKGAAIGGAVGGAIGGAGIGLQEPDATVSSVAGSTAIGTGLGGVAGAGLVGAGKLVAPALRGAGEKLGISLGKKTLPQQIQKAAMVYDNILGGTKKQVNLINAFKKQTGENLTEYLVQNGLELRVSKDGTKFATKEVAENFKDGVLENLENTLQDILKPWKNAKLVDLSDIGAAVIREIGQDTSVDALTILQRQKIVRDFIEAEIQRAGGVLVDLPTANQLKRNYWKLGYEMMSPQKQPTARAIGRGLMNRIEEVVADPIVKDLNKEMRKAIMASDFLEKITGDAVKGGRLGRGTTRLIGTVAGIKMGPVGALASGEVLTKLVAHFGSVEKISVKAIKELMDSGVIPSHIRTIEEARTFLANLMKQRKSTLLLGQGPIIAGDKTVVSGALPQDQAVKRLEELGTLPGRFQRMVQSSPKLLEAGDKNASGVPIPLRGVTEYGPQAKIIGQMSKITQDELPLLLEARRYKSAEQFIEAQGGQSYFHSTDAKNVPAIEQSGFKASVGERSLASKGDMTKGVFLYDEVIPANEFGKNFVRQGKKPATIETKVSGKIYDANINTKYGWEDDLQIQEIASNPKIIEQLKKDGFVGATSTELGTNATFVFEPSIIKTKSQLTDIWNRARDLQ